jgi:hypothetical protein
MESLETINKIIANVVIPRDDPIKEIRDEDKRKIYVEGMIQTNICDIVKNQIL